MSTPTTLPTLYPHNATTLEMALEQAFARRLAALQAHIDEVVPALWNAGRAPVSGLDSLAWASGVAAWRTSWPIEYKRQAIAAAKPARRRIGTIGALRETLAAMGQPGARILERSLGVVYRDMRHTRDTGLVRGSYSTWATVTVLLPQPITEAQATALRAAIDAVKRNCVHVVALDYSANPVLRDVGYARDAGYSRGIV